MLRDARVSIHFADDGEFETRADYLVNQWPEVRDDAELDLCFGVPGEQVTYGADRYRFHVATGNPIPGVSELERERRRVELVGVESAVPEPIQPSCLYRVQPFCAARSQKCRPFLSHGVAGPTARTRALTRKPITGRVRMVNRPDQRLTVIRGCDDMGPKQRDRRIF